MNRTEYWEEAFAAALEEACIPIPDAGDLRRGARVLEGAHENIGLAFRVPENPLAGEVRELKTKLKHEQEMVHCRECSGRGRIITHGPAHSANSTCWKCNGSGKIHESKV